MNAIDIIKYSQEIATDDELLSISHSSRVTSNARTEILALGKLQPRAGRCLASTLGIVAPPRKRDRIVVECKEDDDTRDGNGGR